MRKAISPALKTYASERLRSASVFMMLHAALPAVAGIVLAESATQKPELANDTAELTRIWTKFTSDMTPAEFYQFCDEVWHCRNVDALERYLSTMLFDVFTQRPEALRSSEQVRVSDVLDCDDMAQVVRKLAERKVTALAYQGLDVLLSDLREKLGLPIDPADPGVSAVREGIEVRNIVVHNGGLVNALFVRRTKRNDLAVGTAFPLNQDYVIAHGRAARNLLEKLDEAFVGHFGLKYADKNDATA